MVRLADDDATCLFEVEDVNILRSIEPVVEPPPQGNKPKDLAALMKRFDEPIWADVLKNPHEPAQYDCGSGPAHDGPGH